MNNYTQELKHWIFYNWKIHQPKWFITLLWNDLPTDPIQVINHSRHFKNVFLTKLYGVNKCSKLKDFPNRLGMMFFQERKEMYNKGRRLISFHTHLHLYNTTELLTNIESVNQRTYKNGRVDNASWKWNL